jgi:hypothetical protein
MDLVRRDAATLPEGWLLSSPSSRPCLMRRIDVGFEAALFLLEQPLKQRVFLLPWHHRRVAQQADPDGAGRSVPVVSSLLGAGDRILGLSSANSPQNHSVGTWLDALCLPVRLSSGLPIIGCIWLGTRHTAINLGAAGPLSERVSARATAASRRHAAFSITRTTQPDVTPEDLSVEVSCRMEDSIECG